MSNIETNATPPEWATDSAAAPACSARMAATTTGMREIRRLCDEALDHGMGWPSFCAMIRHRLDMESAFVEMANVPNTANHEEDIRKAER
jgi:hypothetical protein